MNTQTTPANKKKKLLKKSVHLKNWDEVAAYYAEHLKPVGKGPKGQPIYSAEDIKGLNVRLPG